MPAPRKYPEELNQRAIRLCLDALEDPDRAKGCFKRIGDELEMLRGRVRQVWSDAHECPGSIADDAVRFRRLRRGIGRRVGSMRSCAERARVSSGWSKAACERHGHDSSRRTRTSGPR